MLREVEINGDRMTPTIRSPRLYQVPTVSHKCRLASKGLPSCLWHPKHWDGMKGYTVKKSRKMKVTRINNEEE